MFNYFKPARSEAQKESPEVKILCDFDSILSTSVGFKFKGKVYTLNPVDVESYMKLTLAYRDILQIGEMRAKGIALTEDEVYIKYFNLIHPLTPELPYEDVKKMPFVLLNKLINLILKQLAGDPELYDNLDEKKNPLTQSYGTEIVPGR